MKTKHEIVLMPIGEIKPYENNPRINDDAVDKVKNSIKEFGFTSPIILDENNVIICGHTRLKAAEALKMKAVPCIIKDDLTPEQVKAYRLADNKVGELATWDFGLLDEELADLEFDMSDFGFDSFDANIDNDFDRQFGEFGDEKSKQFFDITLTFAAEHEDMVKEYMKSMGGRDGVADMIIKLAQEGE